MNSATSNRFRVLGSLLIVGLLLCGGGSLFCPMSVSAGEEATPAAPAGYDHSSGSGGECPESLASSAEHIVPWGPAMLPEVGLLGLTWVLEHAGLYPLLVENKTNHSAPLRFLLLSTFRL